MKTHASPAVGDRQSAVAKPLQIVFAYDHPPAAEAARAGLNGILTKCAADLDIHRDEWSFAELENPQCRSEALELAVRCDLFVVAVTGVEDLPESFLMWLTDWFASRAQMDSALIICVGTSDANMANMPFLASLPTLVRCKGLSCFTTASFVPETQRAPLPKITSLFDRLRTIASEFLPEHSGIND
jgi:hypothetical protein